MNNPYNFQLKSLSNLDRSLYRFIFFFFYFTIRVQSLASQDVSHLRSWSPNWINDEILRWIFLRIAWNGLKRHEERREPRSSADSSNARIFRDTSRGETATRLALRAIFLARDVSCIRHRWQFFNGATSSLLHRWIVMLAHFVRLS